MNAKLENGRVYSEASVYRMLFRIAPPIMLAQTIQSLYNIIDSIYVSRVDEAGLTALSAMMPVQFLITAIAVGIGTGVNIVMARSYGMNDEEHARETAGAGQVVALMAWLIFSVLSSLLMRPYMRLCTASDEAFQYACSYGSIVCIGSIGLFLESCWTKILQAGGDMKRPMRAQIAGALINIVLDPVLIFGFGPVPAFGVKGAAAATLLGQLTAALITGSRAAQRIPSANVIRRDLKEILNSGFPTLVMQSLWAIYISILNMILAGFGDDAVTVLGLYYKLQSFFFIPFIGLRNALIPAVSYNYAAEKYERCKEIFWKAAGLSALLMMIGVLCFVLIPEQMIRVFSSRENVIFLGIKAFHVLGLSYLPAVTSFMFPLLFQAIGQNMRSSFLSVLRQIILLVPMFYLFSKISLDLSWWAFVLSDVICSIVGWFMYRRETAGWKEKDHPAEDGVI